MKSLILILLVACIGTANAQIMFSVKPGLTGNAAQAGLKIGGLMAFGGIEFFRTSATTENSGSRVEYNYNTYPYQSFLVQYSDKTEFSTTAYIPFIGAKILLGGKETGKTGAYVTGIIGKPFITGKQVSNGKESESAKKFFESLSAWMFQGGFGAEYFFSDDFSIGGEFGLRALLVNYKEENNQQTTQVYDYQTGQYKTYSTPSKYNFDLGVGITYSTLVLNYYF
jgi:hypothetical protein